MLVDLNRWQAYKGTEGSTATMPTMGAEGDMTLGMMIGKDYDDPDVCQAMRQATHRILYTVANSHAMNGFTAETQIVGVTPWWQTALYALCIVMGVLTVGSVYKFTKAVKKSKAAKA